MMNNKTVNRCHLLCLAAILPFLTGCGPQPPAFRLKGKIENMKGGCLYLYNLTVGNASLDTLQVKNGKFSHEGTADGIEPFILVFPNAVEQVIFAEGGKTIDYRASLNDLKHYRVEGSETNELMNEFRMKTVDESSATAVRNIATHYIKTYPDSPIATYLLDRYYVQDNRMNIPQAENLIRGMKLVQPDNLYILTLERQIARKKSGVIGKTLPDIRMQTYRKDSISLNGFKNDHTLICFWATWLENAYSILDRVNQFHDKYGRKNDIKIISVSLDGEKYQWEGYVRADTLNVTHCYDGLTWESPAARKLGVMSLPYFILADKKHKIIAASNNLDALQDGLEPTTP